MTLLVRVLLGASSIQDGGRPGYRKYGVPPSGAFDRRSLAAANSILGNRPDDPALEMGGGTLEIEALDDGPVAWAGAPCRATLNGAAIEGGAAWPLQRGDTLRLDSPTVGLRYYFALAGGIAAPVYLGSRSGWVPEKGSVLRSMEDRPPPGVPATPELELPELTVLRVHPGPQASLLDRQVFVGGEYEVTPMLDRVGVRLEGPSLGQAPEIVSEPCFFGSVQVDRSGQPIILGPDGPTIGGYPKIAQLAGDDLDRVAQLRPGARVRFLWL